MAQDNLPPESDNEPFVYAAVPRDGEEATLKSPTSYAINIVKGALIAYFKEFIDGRLTHVLQNLAPYSLNFTTDTILEKESDRRHIQIARRVAQLYQKLPQILIADTGETVNPPGLGYYDARLIDKETRQIIYRRTRRYEVPLEIVAASRDEESCMALREMIGIMIENRDKVGSILSDNTNWEVVLPAIYSPSARSTQPVGEDTQDTFSIITISYNPTVEIIWFERESGTDRACLLNGNVGRPIGDRRIEAPSKVRLNSKETVRIFRYPPGTIVITDRPDIAIVTAPPDRRIIPLCVGKCNLLIYTKDDTVNQKLPLEVVL